MSIVFRFLNVGHGSSVVIERQENGRSFFGLVDSNASANTVPRALSVLRELGATRLSFICLTHPHKDHYSGLYEVIRNFTGSIDTFYTNPMGELLSNRERFDKLSRHLVSIAKGTDGMAERRAAIEFAQILRWASTDQVEWVECGGEFSQLAPTGFAGVQIHSLLPPRRNVANYVARIEAGDPLMFGATDDNELSLALHFQIGGTAVLLGGDGTVSNWQIRRRWIDRGGNEAKARVVNLPHHGSGHDNPPEVLSQLFSLEGERFAVTSANGLSHPSIDVIERLSAAGIQPYCTNLHRVCGATVAKLIPASNINPELMRVLRESSIENSVIQPCQGDITVTLSDGGDVSIHPEYRNYCSFRRSAAA